MTRIPAKVSSRLAEGLKRFQPIVEQARSRDVGEADTVTVVKDFLADVLGYDKYSELTSEHAIRGTFCDLAVKIDGTLAWLVEVKAAGLELKEAHIKQAVDYAANQGCEWVVLTNASTWFVYRLSFSKPIQHTLVASIDIPSLNARKSDSLELLWILSREGWKKSHLETFAAHQELLSAHNVAAVIFSEGIVSAIRRELRRINPQARVDEDDIVRVLRSGVIRREVLDGENAARAAKTVARAARNSLRQTNGNTDAVRPENPEHSDSASSET